MLDRSSTGAFLQKEVHNFQSLWVPYIASVTKPLIRSESILSERRTLSRCGESRHPQSYMSATHKCNIGLAPPIDKQAPQEAATCAAT